MTPFEARLKLLDKQISELSYPEFDIPYIYVTSLNLIKEKMYGLLIELEEAHKQTLQITKDWKC